MLSAQKLKDFVTTLLTVKRIWISGHRQVLFTQCQVWKNSETLDLKMFLPREAATVNTTGAKAYVNNKFKAIT